MAELGEWREMGERALQSPCFLGDGLMTPWGRWEQFGELLMNQDSVSMGKAPCFHPSQVVSGSEDCFNCQAVCCSGPPQQCMSMWSAVMGE